MSTHVRKVLIVEDDNGMRAFLEEGLQKSGYSVYGACNGIQAKGIFEQFKPDVLVLDIVMPDMDGIEFIKWLSSQAPGVKVVIISGYNMRYAEIAHIIGEASGMLGIQVLTKPLRLNEILAAVS